MSLNYNISKCENYDELKVFGTFDDNGRLVPDPNGTSWQLQPYVESLVWISMLAGFDKITKDNWSEVFVRVAMVETVIGPYRSTKEGGVYFTPAEVKRCIGLTTNSQALNKTKFDSYVARMLRRPCEDVLRAFHTEQEAANESQDAVETEAETD